MKTTIKDYLRPVWGHRDSFIEYINNNMMADRPFTGLATLDTEIEWEHFRLFWKAYQVDMKIVAGLETDYLLLKRAVETATDFLTTDELVVDYEEHADN